MARVVHVDRVPMIERPHVREGVLRSRRLLTGEPGTPGNFSLQLSSTPTYDSPRHRHNFDQVRFQLRGDFNFSADGVMKPGYVAYFPEGTFYGPQSCPTPSETLVLQFGGASGSGYLSAEQYEQASIELARQGTFANGVFTRMKPDGGKKNQDAYEAVWEHVHRRPLIYPGERYLRPIFMDPTGFDWTPVVGQPGARCKPLGEFSERRTRIALCQIEPGAKLCLEDHSIYFVLSGAGTAGEEGFQAHATVHSEAGEQAVLRASEPTEALHITLPHFS
jgi:hypothetical protein